MFLDHLGVAVEITTRIGNATALEVVVQQARRARGVRQRKLVARWGMPVQLLSNLENGRPPRRWTGSSR